jgi:hypothetical protein
LNRKRIKPTVIYFVILMDKFQKMPLEKCVENFFNEAKMYFWKRGNLIRFIN